MIRAIREDGEIFKVLFLRKEVPGLLTRKLCVLKLLMSYLKSNQLEIMLLKLF